MANKIICVLPIFSLLLHLSASLYQDQVGKFDWRKRYIGCPHQSWFGRIASEDSLLIVSKENVLGRVDMDSGEIVWRQVNENLGSEQLQIMAVEKSSIVLQAGQKQRSFDVHTGSFLGQKKVKMEETSRGKQQQPGNGLLSSSFDPPTGKITIEQDQREKMTLQIEETAPKMSEVKVMDAREEGLYKIFVRREGCRMDLYEFAQNGGAVKLLWSRHESLATISDVLMVDMPLSESQAQIESEFNMNDPILRSFLLRIRSQLEQLHRFFTKTAERFVRTMNLILRGELSYSVLLKQFFSVVGVREDQALERDYFNMRKMIVVSTLAGTLHGLSTDNGRVLWTCLLSERFSPYKQAKVPLLLLRGTAFYQWESQAAAVFDIKDSADSFVLVFNPITGEQIQKIEIQGGLSRFELWPFSTSEQLHPLLMVRKSRPNQAELWPSSAQKEFAENKPVYVMAADKETGILTGYEVRFDAGKQLRERWRSSLPNFGKSSQEEVIEAISGKALSQKVHSQGRVLGDRSVLYKYANPNLLAILTSNREELTLRLHLVDSVSGQLVYSGKYSKALPPFHIVHCENWIVVSYWNEKARRTEVGVVELFEGIKPTNSTAFDSMAATNEPVKVSAQTYIFPQGISAMFASDTEQGLTSRSVLIAIPFGGVLEMSRRFLDARRPMEMSQESREEIPYIIPYIPELPLATEDLINYNQTVIKVRGIRTAPSGLESTSLVFVYGLDLFYTRTMPSGTFDILKDDFDYFFISAVMLLLTLASYVCKRISRYQSIQKAWE